MLITSSHNQHIKQIRALASRKERERTGLFFVEGIHLVLEADQTGAPIELLVVASELLRSPRARDLVQRAGDRGVRTLTVSGSVFQEIAPRTTVQGVGAVVHQRWTPFADLPPPQRLGLIALNGTQYPGNLGTIIRTGDAAGADGIVLLDATSDPYDPIAVRASVGASSRFRSLALPSLRSSLGLASARCRSSAPRHRPSSTTVPSATLCRSRL
jgi:TrmH family RNA methyltransferase